MGGGCGRGLVVSVFCCWWRKAGKSDGVDDFLLDFFFRKVYI